MITLLLRCHQKFSVYTTACRLAAKKLVRDSIALRKNSVAQFLSTIRGINRQVIDINTFEDGTHTSSSEPFFYDTAYKVSAAVNKTVVDHPLTQSVKHNWIVPLLFIAVEFVYSMVQKTFILRLGSVI